MGGGVAASPVEPMVPLERSHRGTSLQPVGVTDFAIYGEKMREYRFRAPAQLSSLRFGSGTRPARQRSRRVATRGACTLCKLNETESQSVSGVSVLFGGVQGRCSPSCVRLRAQRAHEQKQVEMCNHTTVGQFLSK